MDNNNSTKRKDERLELYRSNGSISHEIKLINSKYLFCPVHSFFLLSLYQFVLFC